MKVLRLVLLFSVVACVVALTATCRQNPRQQVSKAPNGCPVTVPPAIPFTPPSPYPTEVGDDFFWLGSDKLWTSVTKSGVWECWAPHPPGQEHRALPLSDKTGWGSVEFDLFKESYPDLKVTGRRLDGDAPAMLATEPTNFYTGPTAAHAEMGVGVYFPTPGCWEITGEYHGQKLSFVAFVTPVKDQPVKYK